MEAEKATLEAQNTALQVTPDAANAATVAAEAAAAAAASGSSGGGDVSAAAADTIAKAMKKSEKAKLHEECTFPHGITYPMWPAFDPSVKFDGHGGPPVLH